MRNRASQKLSRAAIDYMTENINKEFSDTSEVEIGELMDVRPLYHTKFYCTDCGLKYYGKTGNISRCEECGRKLDGF